MMELHYGVVVKMATGSNNTSLLAMSAPLYNVNPYDIIRSTLTSTTTGGSNAPSLARVYNSSGSQGIFAFQFPSNTVEYELYAIVQLPHTYNEGTSLIPRLNILTTASATGTTSWGLEYSCAGVNGTYNTTTININATLALTPSSANQNLILSFPSIPGTGLTVSSIIMCRLYRYPNTGTNADTYTQSLFVPSFAFMFTLNTAGSRQPYVK